jgi:hypothetical protein
MAWLLRCKRIALAQVATLIRIPQLWFMHYSVLFINFKSGKNSITTGPSARAHFLQSITLLADHLSTYHLRLTNQPTNSCRRENWRGSFSMFRVWLTLYMGSIYQNHLNTRSISHWRRRQPAGKRVYSARQPPIWDLLFPRVVRHGERILLLFAELITST